MSALVLLFVVWVACAGRFLVSVGPPPRQADAVFSLSGDPLGNRLRAAARVLRATDHARLVAFVEGPSSIFNSRESAGSYLESQGVQSGRIRLTDPGSSTAEEAGIAAAAARQCDWDSIVVVTSPFHTRRAGWLFSRAVGDQAEVATVSDGESFNAATWWADDADTETVLQEWLKGLSSLRYLVSAPEGPQTTFVC